MATNAKMAMEIHKDSDMRTFQSCTFSRDQDTGYIAERRHDCRGAFSRIVTEHTSITLAINAFLNRVQPVQFSVVDKSSFHASLREVCVIYSLDD
jgi:hypothetical protein